MKYVRRTSGYAGCTGIKAVFLCVLILLLSFMPILSYAAGGDGSGSGGGSSVPLAMVSSTPADGAGGVSTTPVIACRFSHNVAEASISASNLSHISLKKADGTPVAVRTYVADVQIEFDKRQYLYAEPAALDEGTTYILTLSAGIRAKNGMTTASTQTVTFTTEGSAAPSPGGNDTPASSGTKGTAGTQTSGANTADPDDSTRPDSQNVLREDSTEDSEAEQGNTAEEKDSEEQQSGQDEVLEASGEDSLAEDDGATDGAAEKENDGETAGSTTAWIIAIVIVVAAAIAGTAVFAVRRKRKK